MLMTLLRQDRPVTVNVVKLVTHSLISERLETRKWATVMKYAVLRQLKRKHPKVAVSIKALAGSEVSESDEVICGPRPENHWICYDAEKRPLTEEAWNARHFFHKPHIGQTFFWQNGQNFDFPLLIE